MPRRIREVPDFVRTVEVANFVFRHRLDADSLALERDVLDPVVHVDDDRRLRVDRGGLRGLGRCCFVAELLLPVAGVDEDLLDVLCGEVVLVRAPGLRGGQEDRDLGLGRGCMRRDRVRLQVVTQAGERIEGAAAASATHRAACGAQGRGRHAEPCLAVRTLGIHGPGSRSRQSARRRPLSRTHPARVADNAISKHGR